MCKIICVTNRLLCRDNFIKRIEKIAENRPYAIILREKDLPENEYEALAREVGAICGSHNVLFIPHSYYSAAAKLESVALHLPFEKLKSLSEDEKRRFTVLGSSCHSPDDAVEAEKLGCTYITAGHVFDTDCKKGLPGRGLDFLRGVCGSVKLPVFAIGGISYSNIADVINSGAAGVCVMSSLMTCADVGEYLNHLKNAGDKYGKRKI